MKKYVISIGRQLGSGGKDIAEKLSQKLGIQVYDKKILEAAAQESGIDTDAFEKADEKESSTFLEHFIALRDFISGCFAGQSSCMNSDQLFQIQSEAIRNIAERESCITIGRCSEYILRDHPNMISIFVTADIHDRVSRIMNSKGMSEEEAMEFIERGDKKRKSYHDYYAATEWGVARHYDLCINSSRLGIDGTVEFIYEFAKRRLGI